MSEKQIMRKQEIIGRNVFWGVTVFLSLMMNAHLAVADRMVELVRANIQSDQLAKRNSDLNTFGSGSANDVLIKEKQVVEINSSLRNIIEENQRLSGENQKLETELQRLRDEYNSGQKVYEDLRKDRDGLADSVKQVRTSNRQYSQRIKELEESIKESEIPRLTSSNDQLAFNGGDTSVSEEEYQTEGSAEFAESAESAESVPPSSDEIYNAAEDTSAPVENDDIQSREIKALDLLTKIDAFAEGDERLRTDSARAHYNMGNIYFQKGEFELAAREYYQAVTLMPNDPDVHYNLAFVSGEHLRDFKTALKHYQMYLYLNPQAKDKLFVREKILHAKLALDSIVDSPLEK